jgi:tRNA modification GTPase
MESDSDNPNICLHRLQHAPTLRTASILLDQWHGALAEEVRRIRATLETKPEQALLALQRLAEWGLRVGRHLVEPWQVVIAGPPNAGKSSLVNALVGYQRTVVSEVPGTTRDAVSIRTAFDGWPVELFDTAGLRDATGLEAAGIEQTRQRLRHADAIVWVTDATTAEAPEPDPETVAAVPLRLGEWIGVRNKVDLLAASSPQGPASTIALSAKTGENIAQLIHAIVVRLVPDPPPPGAAVPYTPRLIEYISLADKALREKRLQQAKHLLDEAYQLDQLSRTTASAIG